MGKVDIKVDYKNDDSNKIYNHVKNEFEKNIDSYGERDDKEIYQAGLNIVKKYLTAIKGDRNNNYGPWALEPLNNLYNKDLLPKYKSLKGYVYFRKNKELINEIANKIADCKKLVLNRLKPNNEYAKNIRMQKRSIEVNKGKKYFEPQRDGTIIFTKESNPLNVKIHDVMNGLFNKGEVYNIDYSGCKSEKIRNKIIQLTGGTDKCYISYDPESKTYPIRDKSGHPLKDVSGAFKNRALIYEGVKLIPGKVMEYRAENAEMAAKKKLLDDNEATLGNIKYDNLEMVMSDDDEKTREWKNMHKDIMQDIYESGLSNFLGNNVQQFVEANERRLNDIIKEAKSQNYLLHTDPVSKLYFSSGLMEVKLVNGNTEKDIKVWDENGIGTYNGVDASGKPVKSTVSLDKNGTHDIYKILDKHEDEYKQFLVKRLKQKWDAFKGLTKHNDIFAGNGSKLEKGDVLLDDKGKATIKQGLGMLEEFIEKLRTTEGRSYFDDGANCLSKIVELIENANYSIDKGGPIRKSVIKNNLIAPLAENYTKFTHKLGLKTQFQNLFNKLMFGSDNDQIIAIRGLSRGESNFGDVTESSDVVTKKILDQNIELEDAEINTCFQNIDLLLKVDEEELTYDGNGTLIKSRKTECINDLYRAATTQPVDQRVFAILYKYSMVPKKWWTNPTLKNRVLGKCKNIADQLKEKNFLLKKMEREASHYEAEMTKNEKAEKIALEKKENKTEDDLIRLQALTFLESNEEARNELHKTSLKKMIDSQRYMDINSLVKFSLKDTFVKEGKGAKGDIGKILNDVVGYGTFDVSDESVKMIQEIATEIAITVVVAAITGGFGGAVVSAGLRGLAGAARLSRYLKMANSISKLNKISRLVSLNNHGLKAFRVASTAERATVGSMNVASTMIEGMTFNNVAKLIKNPLQGKEMFEGLDLNPLSRENIQTAAFLGSLSIWSKIVGKAFSKVGSTRFNINWSEGFNNYIKSSGLGPKAASFGTELSGMLLAEQTMNITFGHEVIDPETGEVKTVHGLTWPEKEERGQMIGMILGMKTIRPKLWPAIKMRLDNGTLKVCKNTRGEWMIATSDGRAKNLNEVKKNPELLEDMINSKREALADEFDAQVLGEGITVNGDTYKLEYRSNPSNNKSKKGEYVWLKNGEVIRSVKAETRTLPDNADGNRIRAEYNRLRSEYAGKKLNEYRVKKGETTVDDIEIQEGRIDESLEGLLNGEGEVKLDWVTEKMFEAGVFCTKLHNWFKKLSESHNNYVHRKPLESLQTQLIEMVKKRGDKISSTHKKLIDKYNKFINEKLKSNNEKIQIEKDEILKIENSHSEEVGTESIFEGIEGLDLSAAEINALKPVEHLFKKIFERSPDFKNNAEELKPLLKNIAPKLKYYDQLGIKLTRETEIIPTSKVSEADLQKIIGKKNLFDELGIELNINDLEILAKFAEGNSLNSVLENKLYFDELGIGLNVHNIENLSSIPKENLDAFLKLKDNANKNGITIESSDYEVAELKYLKVEELNHINSLLQKLHEFYGDLSLSIKHDFGGLKELNEKVLDYAISIKDYIKPMGVRIHGTHDLIDLARLSGYNLKEISKRQQKLKDIGLTIDSAYELADLGRLKTEEFDVLFEKIPFLKEIGCSKSMLLYEVNINVLKDIPNEILKKYAKVKNVLLNDNSNLENINYKTFKEVVEYISYFRKAEIDFKGINNFIEKVAESNPLVIEKVLKHAKVFDSLEKILDYPQFVEVFDRIPDEIIEKFGKVKEVLEENGIDISDPRNIEYYGSLDSNLLLDREISLEKYNYPQAEKEAFLSHKEGHVIEKIENYLNKKISENKDLNIEELLLEVKTDIRRLTPDKRILILNNLNKFVEKGKVINKYLDFEKGPYKSPKELLLAMRGITEPDLISKITDDITVKRNGTSIVFFVGDQLSYGIIESKMIVDISEIKSGGFNSRQSYVDGLKNTLSVVNGKDGLPYSKTTVIHESQHNANSYWMIDKGRGEITRAKDEILAYYKDGRSITEIREILKEENGLYDYFKDHPSHDELWNKHVGEVEELIKHIEYFDKLNYDHPEFGLTKTHIINILSRIPHDKWGDYKTIMKEATEKPEKETKNKLLNLLRKLKSNSVVSEIVQRWNSHIKIGELRIKEEEVWRSHLANKESTLKEISLAKNINELKDILNHPMYSHISYGRNNLSGIEVSGIIDEVVAGNLNIKHIPRDIRGKVESLL